jgi:hypothetical protein
MTGEVPTKRQLDPIEIASRDEISAVQLEPASSNRPLQRTCSSCADMGRGRIA